MIMIMIVMMMIMMMMMMMTMIMMMIMTVMIISKMKTIHLERTTANCLTADGHTHGDREVRQVPVYATAASASATAAADDGKPCLVSD